MKFFADECFFQLSTEIIRGAGYDVAIVKERKLCGLKDTEVIELCQRENRILLTLDTDFNNILRFPLGTNPGIILVRILPQDARIVAGAIVSFLKKNSLEAFSGGLVIIAENKIRICRKGAPTITAEI